MSKYVIIDLEMCNVPKSVKPQVYDWSHEVIQIGAVLVDEKLEITDSFVTYVSAQFGTVDRYIEKLTGITQKDISGAPRFKEAMEQFMRWLPEDCVWVSWSDNDELQIRKETGAKGLTFEGLEGYLDSWIDCQKTFASKMDAPKSYKLSEALIIADVDYEDGAHDALVDAKNTARLFIKMEKEPKLKLNPGYSESVEETTHNPFAKLLEGYKFC